MLEEKIGDDPNLNLHVRWKRKRLILKITNKLFNKRESFRKLYVPCLNLVLDLKQQTLIRIVARDRTAFAIESKFTFNS